MTHELASEPHLDHLGTQLSKACCQGLATTYPRRTLTPILPAAFSSLFLLSLELLKEMEGEEHGGDSLQLRVREPDFLLRCLVLLLTNKASVACYFFPSSKR